MDFMFKLVLAALAVSVCYCQTNDEYKQTLSDLGRQLMLQQLYVEERIRSDGDSGIKQVRVHRGGTKPYYSESHVGYNAIAAIHDHANNIRTVGMGEVVVVLNGVEFRTRHNDYSLRMPSRKSGKYHALDNIPFPDVPPTVLNKPSVKEQIIEMRKWFKAWADQDDSVRDYKKYFKPVLCYLEGAWTDASGSVEESFPSDRHFLDASTWYELEETLRFTSYTGTKSNLENLAFLPRTVMNVTDDGVPIFGQWNYRILCHPLKDELPLKRLRVVDDLVARMVSDFTLDRYEKSRTARFQVTPTDREPFTDSRHTTEYLDELMSQIPGMDNYGGYHTDSAFSFPAYPTNGSNSLLNTAYYHRFYVGKKQDAMGLQNRRRAFSDSTVFFAQTGQDKVMGMSLTKCKSRYGRKTCTSTPQKWSYAIPLEIIYMTPLSKWNPYNIEYKGVFNSVWGKTVRANKRYGGKTLAKALNGTNSKNFYQTPSEFFKDTEVNRDPADTAAPGSIGVLDKNGNMRIVRASGTRIFMPEIQDVGVLRQRYPIMPIHGEGRGIWKEFEALRELLMNPDKHRKIFYSNKNTNPDKSNVQPTKPNPSLTGIPRLETVMHAVDLHTTPSGASSGGQHVHGVHLTGIQVAELADGKQVTVTTELANGHSHILLLKYHPSTQKTKQWIQVMKCDRGKSVCRDGHKNYLVN